MRARDSCQLVCSEMREAAQTGLALPLAFSGTFTELVALSVMARMATYIGTAAAIPVLRRTVPTTPRTIRLPGGPAIPSPWRRHWSA